MTMEIKNYWLVFQKFYPDTDMLTIKVAKAKNHKTN